jgi:hypothetical protein
MHLLINLLSVVALITGGQQQQKQTSIYDQDAIKLQMSPSNVKIQKLELKFEKIT